MDLSIVIVNWNTRALLLDCLRAIFSTINRLSFEVWLVDNASSDGSIDAVRSGYPEVCIIQNQENVGFAAANNRALGKIHGRYAMLLNTDAVLTQGAVERLFDFMERNPEAGMAGGQLLNGDGTLQNSTASFPDFLSVMFNESLLRILMPGKYSAKGNHQHEPVEIDSIIGACLVVRKKAIEQVGLLDERFFFFFEETDWALRMKRNGWRIFFVPHAKIYHIQGQSVGHGTSSRIHFYRSRYTYFKKWSRKIYPLLFPIAIARIFVNLVLNFFGTLLTLGLAKGPRKKIGIYFGLLLWHITGCPQDR